MWDEVDNGHLGSLAEDTKSEGEKGDDLYPGGTGNSRKQTLQLEREAIPMAWGQGDCWEKSVQLHREQPNWI